MVGERVRFLCTSCERLQTSKWAQWTSEFSNFSQQVHNRNRSYKRTNHEVIRLFYMYRNEVLTLMTDSQRTIHELEGIIFKSQNRFLPFICRLFFSVLFLWTSAQRIILTVSYVYMCVSNVIDMRRVFIEHATHMIRVSKSYHTRICIIRVYMIRVYVSYAYIWYAYMYHTRMIRIWNAYDTQKSVKAVFHFNRIVTYRSIFFCVKVISSTLVLRKQRNDTVEVENGL
jgi:hypothetical protein